MTIRLLAIGEVSTPQWRLLNATKWLLGAARATHEDLEVELINLATTRLARGWQMGWNARRQNGEQYLEDAAAH